MRNKLGRFVKGNEEGFKKGHPNYRFEEFNNPLVDKIMDTFDARENNG